MTVVEVEALFNTLTKRKRVAPLTLEETRIMDMLGVREGLPKRFRPLYEVKLLKVSAKSAEVEAPTVHLTLQAEREIPILLSTLIANEVLDDYLKMTLIPEKLRRGRDLGLSAKLWIIRAFSWTDTDQNHEFWRSLHNELQRRLEQ